jgi:hypothetical protein
MIRRRLSCKWYCDAISRHRGTLLRCGKRRTHATRQFVPAYGTLIDVVVLATLDRCARLSHTFCLSRFPPPYHRLILRRESFDNENHDLGFAFPDRSTDDKIAGLHGRSESRPNIFHGAESPTATRSPLHHTDVPGDGGSRRYSLEIQLASSISKETNRRQV